MYQPHRVYIALGSNLGDKFKNLQMALDHIHQDIGHIRSISKVFKSEAQGFEGGEFLNACIGLETDLKPERLLKKLIAIEKRMGRVRSGSKGYESRQIDLDILFFGDKVHKSKALTIPHSKLHKRRFVLEPLHNIAPNEIHPKTGKEVTRSKKAISKDS